MTDNLYLSSGGIRFDLHKAMLESALYPTIAFHPARVSGDIGIDGRGQLTFSGRVTIPGTALPYLLPESAPPSNS